MRIPRGTQCGWRISSIMVGTMLMFLAAGCGSDDAVGPGGPVTLFQDAFDGPSVSGEWMQTLFDCFADIDGAAGNPVPSLRLRTDASAPAAGTGALTTFQPFNSASGLTFTVSLFVDNPGRSGGNADGVSFVMIDQGRLGAARGAVSIHRNGLGGVTVTYSISTADGPNQLINEDIAMPSGFHELKFIINPDGSTKWMRDGIQKLATPQGIQMITADIQLKLGVNGVGAAVDPDQTVAHFDNVTITRP
jgi:hypothetical protein